MINIIIICLSLYYLWMFFLYTFSINGRPVITNLMKIKFGAFSIIILIVLYICIKFTESIKGLIILGVNIIIFNIIWLVFFCQGYIYNLSNFPIDLFGILVYVLATTFLIRKILAINKNRKIYIKSN